MSRCFACNRFRDINGPKYNRLLLSVSKPSVVAPSTKTTSIHKRRINTSIITKIPDELLTEIFIHTLENESDIDRYYETGAELSTISTQFHRVVQPLLYKKVILSKHNLVQPCLVAKQFHRALMGNPALGSMVRILRVYVDCFLTAGAASEAEFTIGREILGALPNVEVFNIHGGYNHPSLWPMLKDAVANWPRIRQIGLSREDWSLLIPPVYDLIVATPSLRSLDLDGVSAAKPGGSTSRTIWKPAFKDIERSSNITNLTVNDFGETPEALQNLLKLFRALKSFTFGRIYSNPSRWSLDMFQGLLADHKTTLIRIEIGALGREHTPINFLDFHQLEILHLSHWVYRESSEVAAASLLAPKLHTFIWDFRVMDQHSESWSDFGESQKEWVLRFAELAAGRKSALRRIEIMFYPEDNEPMTREELAVCVTPWDLMDEVREKIGPLGIKLEYNKCWSKEECLREIGLKEKSDGPTLEMIEVEAPRYILNE